MFLGGGDGQVVANCFRVGANPRRIATARHVAEILLQEGAQLRPGAAPVVEAATLKRKALRPHSVVFEASAPAGQGGMEFVSEVATFELVHGVEDLMLLLLADDCPRRPLTPGAALPADEPVVTGAALQPIVAVAALVAAAPEWSQSFPALPEIVSVKRTLTASAVAARGARLSCRSRPTGAPGKVVVT